MNDRFGRIAPWVALLAGLLLRLVIAVSAAGHEPVSDMATYYRLGSDLADGKPIGTPDRALGYPLALAVLLRAGVKGPGGIYWLQAVASLLTLAGIVRAAQVLGGRKCGRDALLLAAPLLTLAQYSGLLLAENLFLPLWSWSWAWVLEARGRARYAAAAGLLAAAASLVRPAGLPLCAGLLLVLVVRGRPSRRAAGAFALFAVAGTLLGWVVVGRIAGVRPPLTPTAGINLWIGNNDGARADGGGLSPLPGRLAAIEDPGRRDRTARDEAVSWILGHPLTAARLAATRWARLGGVNPGGPEREALLRRGWPDPLVIGWLALEWVLVLALTAWGLARLPEPGGPLRESVLAVAPYVLVLGLTFVQTRFRLPLLVVMLPLAARGLGTLGAGRSPLRRLPLYLAGGWLAAGLTVDLLFRP